MNTCRFCKLTSYDAGPGPLIQYGVRHYAHGPCLSTRKRRAGVDVVALLAARDATTENAGGLGIDVAEAVAREYRVRVRAA